VVAKVVRKIKRQVKKQPDASRRNSERNKKVSRKIVDKVDDTQDVSSLKKALDLTESEKGTVKKEILDQIQSSLRDRVKNGDLEKSDSISGDVVDGIVSDVTEGIYEFASEALPFDADGLSDDAQDLKDDVEEERRMEAADLAFTTTRTVLKNAKSVLAVLESDALPGRRIRKDKSNDNDRSEAKDNVPADQKSADVDTTEKVSSSDDDESVPPDDEAQPKGSGDDRNLQVSGIEDKQEESVPPTEDTQGSADDQNPPEDETVKGASDDHAGAPCDMGCAPEDHAGATTPSADQVPAEETPEEHGADHHVGSQTAVPPPAPQPVEQAAPTGEKVEPSSGEAATIKTSAMILQDGKQNPNWMRFEPAEVHVKPGQEVKFVNDDDSIHTVTAENREFTTNTVQPKTTGTFTAPKTAGKYNFICEFHASAGGTGGMVGTLVVDP
jgi:plastocyanin